MWDKIEETIQQRRDRLFAQLPPEQAALATQAAQAVIGREQEDRCERLANDPDIITLRHERASYRYKTRTDPTGAKHLAALEARFATEALADPSMPAAHAAIKTLAELIEAGRGTGEGGRGRV